MLIVVTALYNIVVVCNLQLVTSFPVTSNSTNSTQCQDGSFYSQVSRKCVPCSPCDDFSTVNKSCTATSDTVCIRCADYNYPELMNEPECKRCPPCNAGEYMAAECTDQQPTVCEPCLEGAFMGFSSYKKHCSPCTDCGLHEVLTECSTGRDTVCGRCKKGYYGDPDTNICRKCYTCLPGQKEKEGCRGGIEGKLCSEYSFRRTDFVRFSGAGINDKLVTTTEVLITATTSSTSHWMNTSIMATFATEANNFEPANIAITVSVIVLVLAAIIIVVVVFRHRDKQSQWKRLPKYYRVGHTRFGRVINIIRHFKRSRSDSERSYVSAESRDNDINVALALQACPDNSSSQSSTSHNTEQVTSLQDTGNTLTVQAHVSRPRDNDNSDNTNSTPCHQDCRSLTSIDSGLVGDGERPSLSAKSMHQIFKPSVGQQADDEGINEVTMRDSDGKSQENTKCDRDSGYLSPSPKRSKSKEKKPRGRHK